MSNPKKEPNVLNRDGWDRFSILLNLLALFFLDSWSIWKPHNRYEAKFECLLPPAEFVKIKEKQKAWAVDNGLRVHEVNQRFSFLIITKDFHFWALPKIFIFDHFQRSSCLVILCIWFGKCLFVLAEGPWRQVDDACFPDSYGKFLSCSKLEMARISPPTYYQFAVM